MVIRVKNAVNAPETTYWKGKARKFSIQVQGRFKKRLCANNVRTGSYFNKRIMYAFVHPPCFSLLPPSLDSSVLFPVQFCSMHHPVVYIVCIWVAQTAVGCFDSHEDSVHGQLSILNVLLRVSRSGCVLRNISAHTCGIEPQNFASLVAMLEHLSPLVSMSDRSFFAPRCV